MAPNDIRSMDQARDNSTTKRVALRERISSNSLALLDQAVVSGANFMTSVLVGRWCGLAELGAFALGCTVLVYGMALQESFIASPYVVFVHRMNRTDRRSYAGSILQQFVFLVLAVALLLTIASVVASWVPALASFRPMIRLLGIIAPCVLLREFARRMAFAHFRWTAALLVDLLVATLQLAGVFGLGWFGVLTGTSALAMVGAATATGGGIWLLFNRQLFAVDPNRFFSDLRDHWAFGRWLCADRLTSIASSNVVPWIVVVFAGLTAAGGFSACLTIVAAANPLLTGLMNTLLPRASQSFADGGVQGLRRELAASAPLFTMVTTLFATALAFCGGTLLRLAYGDEFISYWPALNVISASLLVGMLSAAADFGLRTLERAEVSFATSLAGLLVSLGIALALVPSFGAFGGAFAILGGEACASLLCWFAYQRLTNENAIANINSTSVEPS